MPPTEPVSVVGVVPSTPMCVQPQTPATSSTVYYTPATVAQTPIRRDFAAASEAEDVSENTNVTTVTIPETSPTTVTSINEESAAAASATTAAPATIATTTVITGSGRNRILSYRVDVYPNHRDVQCYIVTITAPDILVQSFEMLPSGVFQVTVVVSDIPAPINYIEVCRLFLLLGDPHPHLLLLK